MRIADKMNFEQVNAGLNKNRAELADLQNQAATQKRVNKPSDDPLAATRVLAARTDVTGSQQYIKNINQARMFLDYSDQSLGELSEVLMRAKELSISQANDSSSNESTRRVVATEIEQLFGQAVQVGNRKVGDRFIFGGYKTTNAPFSSNGDYAGDEGEIRIAVNKEADIAMNVPGSRIFLGQNIRSGRRSSVPSEQKSASPAAPSQEASPKNPATPAVDQKPTTSGNIRGPAQSQTAAPSEGPERADQSLLSASWRNAGTNIFSVLSDLEVSLRANSKEGVQESLDRLDEALAQVVLARSEVGSRLATLNSATENLTKGVVDSKALASSLEDVDTFELVSDLNKSESTLKASLSSSGKLIQPSLLDFLR